jgi:hypothetical protein
MRLIMITLGVIALAGCTLNCGRLCDFDGDDQVTKADLGAQKGAFGTSSPKLLAIYDVNGDGFVSGDDVSACFAEFGK